MNDGASSYRKQFSDRLGKELGLTSREDLDLFIAEAASIIISPWVNGHTDGLNDHRDGYTYTWTYHTKVHYDLFPEEDKGILVGMGLVDKDIPISVILYHRTVIGKETDRYQYFTNHPSTLVREIYDKIESDNAPNYLGTVTSRQKLEQMQNLMDIHSNNSYDYYCYDEMVSEQCMNTNTFTTLSHFYIFRNVWTKCHTIQYF